MYRNNYNIVLVKGLMFTTLRNLLDIFLNQATQEMVKSAITSMSVSVMVMKQNQDTTVTVTPTVQILWEVSCVNVEKATEEMESLAEVTTNDKLLLCYIIA